MFKQKTDIGLRQLGNKADQKFVEEVDAKYEKVTKAIERTTEIQGRKLKQVQTAVRKASSSRGKEEGKE